MTGDVENVIDCIPPTSMASWSIGGDDAGLRFVGSNTTLHPDVMGGRARSSWSVRPGIRLLPSPQGQPHAR